MIGKTIRLGPRTAMVIGVLEPSVPYPADTEIIANMVTSPHHIGATMVTEPHPPDDGTLRAPRAWCPLEEARAELTSVHADMMSEHPEAYSARANVQLSLTTLRDQIAAPARTILLVLLAAAAVVFVIACSNVANLILARSVRREGELAVRAALGAATARYGARCWPRACCSAAPAPCWAWCWRNRSSLWSPAMPPAFPSARSTSPSMPACSGWAPAWQWPRP